MTEIKLKYGCNPYQKTARLLIDREPSPLQILNGNPGYINFLDAFSAWQLVKELASATSKTAAASFKHTSPAGAAITKPLTLEFLESQFIKPDDFSDAACAYIRARSCDRLSSFGDAVAVSCTVDRSLAKFLKNQVSNLIIAPAYDESALEILKSKQKGSYLILQIDKDYEPSALEKREFYGFTLLQDYNAAKIKKNLFNSIVSQNKKLSPAMIENLLVATITLKYTMIKFHLSGL